MNLNAFIYLLLTLLKLCYSTLLDQCSKSNTYWYSIKYPYIDILKLPSTQSSVFTCPSVSSQNCCNSDMNKNMTSISELKLKGFSVEKFESVLMMFSNDSFELMEIYLKDLENTKNDLNKLFSSTYGYNYKVHKEFFFTWFDKLKLYMKGSLNKIDMLLDNFFLEMAQRIVRILIAPDSTPDVTACHTTRLIESKPYQDTDILLKKKIIRSYPPARLLVNAIGVGRDVFKELMKHTSPSSKCVEQFNTAIHCMLCSGLTLKPCSLNCNAIMDNCFGSFKSSDIKKLDKAFTKYIKILVQLASKVDNPFNFPEVNNKMSVQISTAIMNVQTMYPNIKEQIKAKCQIRAGEGGLPISRKRRQASQEFYKWQNENKNTNNNQLKPWWEETINKNINEEKTENKDLSNYQSKPNDSLSPFVRKIKQKYRVLENYFKNKKMEFCSKISVTDASADCWNGTMVIKNSSPVAVKEAKKKGEKIDNPTIKLALSQLNEVTKIINSYLTEANTDPDVMKVEEFKLYLPENANKPTESNLQNPSNQKIDGSGDLEGSKFPQPDFKPEKIKNEQPEITQPSPQESDKTNWEGFPEGSGDSGKKILNENKKKTPKLPLKVNSVVSTTSSISSTLKSTKTSISTSAKSSTVTPNQIPDDEDLNPVPQETLSKPNKPKNVPSTLPSIIQPEGSGNQPDGNEKIPQILPSITTTPSPEPFVEGSAEEFKPKSPDDKPSPFLPMLPDPSKAVTNPPKTIDTKPDLNPDEDVVSVDGSGRSSDPPHEPQQPLPPQPRNPLQTELLFIVTEPSITTTEAISPEQYPGRVPSEVWLPGLEGVKKQENNDQKTTPTGGVPKVSANDLTTTVCRTTFTLLSIYAIFF